MHDGNPLAAWAGYARLLTARHYGSSWLATSGALTFWGSRGM